MTNDKLTLKRSLIVQHSGKLLLLFLILQLGGVTLSWFGLAPLETLLDDPKDEHKSDIINNETILRSKKNDDKIMDDKFINEQTKYLDHTIKQMRAKADRLVVMVVDSMRYDFALSSETNMPYLNSLVKTNRTFSYISKGRTPTMTLGGIKAFTTGKYSPYTDILFNLQAFELQEDNIITTFYHLGKKMHFYGDATWTDLFPYQFEKKDGTEPLYVIDTVEVDHNITRHIPGDMNSTKWDIMITHYLGLDHIGHLTGPKNTLIIPKLKEMDDSVRMIHKGLTYLDSIDNKTSLFVLCSDHGMSDGGSHVGSTKPELEGTQIYMGSIIDRIGGEPYTNKRIEQVDMASTLAFFMGARLPKINTGNIIRDILLRYPPSDVITALTSTACQLFQTAKEEEMKESTLERLMDVCVGKSLHDNLNNNNFWLEANKSITILQDASKELQKTVIKVRENILLFSCFGSLFPVLLIFSTLVIYQDEHKLNKKMECIEVDYLLKKGVFISRYILAASTFLYSSSLFFSSLVEEEPYIIYFFTATVMISVLFSIAIRMMYYKKYDINEDEQCLDHHNVSLLVVMNKNGHSETRSTNHTHPASFHFNEDVLTQPSNETKPVWKHLRDCLVALSVFMILFAFVHRWNNTGIRWLGQDDIGDFLIQPNNSTILSVLVFIAHVAMVTVVALYGDIVNTMMFLIGTIFSFGYRSLDDSVMHVASFHVKTQNGSWMARIVFGVAGAMVLRQLITYFMKLCGFKEFAVMVYRRKLHLVHHAVDFLPFCVLMIGVLCRVHNVVWFSLVLAMEFLATRLIWPTLQKHGFSYIEITMLHLWMSKVTFYSAGNSNSLGSIDFSAGFTGIDAYDPAYATSMTVVSLLFGQIFWIISLIQYIYRSKSDGKSKKAIVYQTCLVVSCYVAWMFFTLTLSVFAQRHDNSLWDVFVVKMVFSSVDCALNLITVILILVIANLNDWSKAKENQ